MFERQIVSNYVDWRENLEYHLRSRKDPSAKAFQMTAKVTALTGKEQRVGEQCMFRLSLLVSQISSRRYAFMNTARLSFAAQR